MEKKEMQMTYYKAKLQENPNQENTELLNKFRKEYQDVKFQVTSKDISLLKQNLKRRNFLLKKNNELIDELITSTGKKFLREKVNLIAKNNI